MADEEKLLAHLEHATADPHETRTRLREAEAAAHEPIAIVDMNGEDWPADTPVPWPVSADDAPALSTSAQRLLEHASQSSSIDFGYSLGVTRSALDHRAVVLAADAVTGHRALSALAEGGTDLALLRGTASEGRTAFLFTGQGAQRAGMGRGLYRAFPAYAAAFDEACAGFQLDAPLREVVLADDDPRLHETTYTQPALFALEVALLRLLESWGLRPDLVLGHSIGELAAAHAAGLLPLPEAVALVGARGRLIGSLPPGGAMAALEATEEEIADLLTDQVGIAAVNGLRSVVVSGDEDAVRDLAAHFAEGGRRTRRLQVSHAFHSARMDPILDRFRAQAAATAFGEPTLGLVSSVTGRPLSAAEGADPDYWVRQVRGPVRFHQGLLTLAELGATRFVEIGPDGVLSGLARGALDHSTLIVPALRARRPEPTAAIEALAALYTDGVDPDWAGVFAGRRARRVPLPT